MVEQVYQELTDERWVTQGPQAFLHRYALDKKPEQAAASQHRRPWVLETVARQLVAHWGQNRAERYIRSLLSATEQLASGMQSDALLNLTELLHYLEITTVQTSQLSPPVKVHIDLAAANRPNDKVWRQMARHLPPAEAMPRYQEMLNTPVNVARP